MFFKKNKKTKFKICRLRATERFSKHPVAEFIYKVRKPSLLMINGALFAMNNECVEKSYCTVPKVQRHIFCTKLCKVLNNSCFQFYYW